MFGAAQGAFADRVIASVDRVLPLPDNVSFDEGAGNVTSKLDEMQSNVLLGLYVTWPTSYEGLVGRANLQKGDNMWQYLLCGI